MLLLICPKRISRNLWFQHPARLQGLVNNNTITHASGAFLTASEGSGSSSGAATSSMPSAATPSVPRTEQTYGPVDDNHREPPSPSASSNISPNETAGPDPLDVEDLHGDHDSSHLTPSCTGVVKNLLPLPVDMSDHNTPSGDIEDLWMQETIHLADLRTSAAFIQAL